MSEKRKPIEVLDGGLECDNPTCDYKDSTPSSEYINCIGKPCPKCGQNLLTQKDYDNHKLMMSVVDIVNVIVPDQLVNPNDKQALMSVSCKQGVITIEVDEDPDTGQRSVTVVTE